MKKPNHFLKVARDMFLLQMSWALWFMGILLIINVGKIVFAVFRGGAVDHYFAGVLVFGNIFMLIIGIISVYFLPHYVGHGVTRKEWFRGTLLAAVGLTVVIPVISIVVYAVEQWIVSYLDNFSFKAIDLNAVISVDDGHFISDLVTDLVQVLVLTPYANPANNWLLAVGVFSLNIFMFYLIGWVISISFHRFNVVAGLGIIVVSIVILVLQDTMLRASLDLPVVPRLEGLDFFTMPTAIPAILLFMLIIIIVIRLMTKRIAIKL